MWKLLVGFIVFAVLAVYLLMKGGADVDMSGEKHGIETPHEATHEVAASDVSASAPASAPVAASEAASGASQ